MISHIVHLCIGGAKGMRVAVYQGNFAQCRAWIAKQNNPSQYKIRETRAYKANRYRHA